MQKRNYFPYFLGLAFNQVHRFGFFKAQLDLDLTEIRTGFKVVFRLVQSN